MIKSPNENLVILIPDEIPDETEGGIVNPEVAKENLRKKQNRGKVTHLGKGCVFCEVGDRVSFYRNAATPFSEDGIDYLVINEAHVLVKLEETNG